ncbi:MAG: MBOAT family protein [Verrucomicrobiota bacterium]
MLFNSLEFAIFLPIVFALYWSFRRSTGLQNGLLTVASYVFYGWWDYRFLGLILLSTAVDYLIGLRISSAKQRKARLGLLWTSIGVNIGILGFFKYFNFFVSSFEGAFSFLGIPLELGQMAIVLPVGISFYTFQTLSYTIDVYRGKVDATRDFIAFSAFVSFFPQLVAGPIERAGNLLPQVLAPRKFDLAEAEAGLRQVIWGFAKKLVIADNCAIYANQIFNDSGSVNGSALLVGAIFFSFQIYGDFSGYSDIAIGISRIFGIRLMRNFAYPYFSRDIAEFWRRWHISLSSWFKDYVYIPLGGSRGGNWIKVRNTLIIFLLSGLWHGANWTFVVWGLLNAIYFIPLILTGVNRRNMEVAGKGKLLPSAGELGGMLLTYGLIVIAWVFFRAEDISHAFEYLGGMFSSTLFEIPEFGSRRDALVHVVIIGVFFVGEWLGRHREFPIDGLKECRVGVRWFAYYLLVLATALCAGHQQEFIYFQF